MTGDWAGGAQVCRGVGPLDLLCAAVRSLWGGRLHAGKPTGPVMCLQTCEYGVGSFSRCSPVGHWRVRFKSSRPKEEAKSRSRGDLCHGTMTRGGVEVVCVSTPGVA